MAEPTFNYEAGESTTNQIFTSNQFWLAPYFFQSPAIDKSSTNVSVVSFDSAQVQPESYVWLGNAHKERGDVQQAVESYKVAISLKPDLLEAYINLGSIFIGEEKLEDAVTVYESALKYNPTNYFILSDLGNLYKSLNKLEEAKNCYVKAIELSPTFATAWSNLGCVYHAMGEVWLSIHHFEKATILDSTFYDAQVNLGNVLKEARIFDRAIHAYLRALILDPENAFVNGSLSCIYYEQGLYDLAIDTCKRALEIQPDYSDAYCNLGNSYKEKGMLVEAEVAYNSALELMPNHIDSLNNLANIKREQGLIEDASILYQRAIEILPSFSAAHSNLASIYQYQGDMTKALHHYRQAIKHSPNFVNAYSNMGNALKEVGDFNSALQCYRRAILINPTFVDAHCNLASLYKDSGNIKEAIVHYNKAISFKADCAEAFCNLVHCNLIICDWENYEEDLKKVVRLVEQQLETGKLPSVHPHHSMLYPMAPELRKEIANRFANICLEKNTRFSSVCYNYPKTKGKRLRIGYVSSDFGNHPTSHLMQSIPGDHSKDSIEIFCYALNASDQTAFRTKVESEAEHFVDLSQVMCNKQAADIINRDGIHILVNMNGYTKGARNEIFAFKPAPVQVMWLGYPGTSGASYMDYIISDRVTTPLELANQFSEKFAFMPNSVYIGDHKNMFPHLIKRAHLIVANSKIKAPFKNDYLVNGRDMEFVDDNEKVSVEINLNCDLNVNSFASISCLINAKQENEENLAERIIDNGSLLPKGDPKIALGEMVPENLILTCRKHYKIPENAFVFCNFNQLYKFDPKTFLLWLNILKKVPNSVLWLLRFPPEGEENINKMLSALQFDRNRIIFTNVGPKEEHVRRGQLADVCLDSPVCNGHTTGLDVLWTGTPILTLMKDTLASRVGASLLACMNLKELITSTAEEYERKAVQLATDKNYLEKIRNKVWEARTKSALFDTKLYAENLEKLYENMWIKHENGEKPNHVTI